VPEPLPRASGLFTTCRLLSASCNDQLLRCGKIFHRERCGSASQNELANPLILLFKICCLI